MSRAPQPSEHRVGSPVVACPLHKATLTIQVVRVDNRQPVAGATVSLAGPFTASRDTSRAGLAQFEALDEETYTIQVSVPEPRAAMFRGTVSIDLPIARGASESLVVEFGARVLLRLKLLRGTAPRTGRCKVILLKAEDGKPESELAMDDSAEIIDGHLHVIAADQVAAAARFAWVYFLDDAGKETGEGLSLTIEAPPAEPDIQVSSRDLRALGFLEKLPLTTARPTPSQTLEIEMALARFQRVFGVPIRGAGAEAYRGLDTRYLDYEHRPASLPRLEFADRAAAVPPVQIRLALYRGTVRRGGRFHAIVDADEFCSEIYRTAARTFSNGEISFPLEGWVAGSARAVRIYLLNADDSETGEGFYLRVAATRDIGEASTRAQILRALGFLEKEPLAGGVTASQRLELDLALARYQRGGGLAVAEDGADLRAALQARYLDYSYAPSALPRLEFRDSGPPRATADLRFRWIRGNSPRDGHCRVFLDSDESGTEIHRGDRVAISGGNIDLKLPQWIVDAVRVCRVYMLDRNNRETGEGLYLIVGRAPDLRQCSEASRVLRALGCYDKQPISGAATATQRLELDLALARCGTALHDPVRSFDPDNAETIGYLERVYLEYRP